jgi:hypothetical protein
MTIHAPKYQSCPECGARCKRTSKNELANTAYYEHKNCKKHGEPTTVKWNVKLRKELGYG